MKNPILIFFAVCLLSLKTLADDPPAESFSLTPAVTVLAASSTNSTAGTTEYLYTGKNSVRIWASCSGIAATTNGVSAVSNIVVRLSTASGRDGVTNIFDTATYSNIKLEIPVTGNGATNVVSSYFILTGSRYLRIGQIENNSLGIVSNLNVFVGYPK